MAPPTAQGLALSPRDEFLAGSCDGAAMGHGNNKSKVTGGGGGNWGSVAAKLIASNTFNLDSFHGLFVASCIYVDVDVDRSIMDQICNERRSEMLDFMTPKAMKTIMEAVVEETPKAKMLNYYTANTAAGVYAHGLCTRWPGSKECADCMKSAYQQLLVNCSTQHTGAQIKLRDCRSRYEIYHFRNDY